MQKPTEIFDRDREWSGLTRAWERNRPELIFVVGRRRVGKSFVLSRFARETKGIYFQATRRTEPEQRAALSMALGQRFDDAALIQGAVLPSWEAIFDYLTAMAKDKPFLLVLDEFTYLTSVSPALTSILQSYWDHRWQDTRIKIVLSDSSVTAMKQLEAHDQPLFGRYAGSTSRP